MRVSSSPLCVRACRLFSIGFELRALWPLILPCLLLLIPWKEHTTAFIFLCSCLSFYLIPLSKLSSFLSLLFLIWSSFTLPLSLSHTLHQKSSHVLGDGVSSKCYSTNATLQEHKQSWVLRGALCSLSSFPCFFNLFICLYPLLFNLTLYPFAWFFVALHCTCTIRIQRPTPLLCAIHLFILPYYMFFLLRRSSCLLP